MTARWPVAAGCETLAVALGANLGDPAATLVAVRPLLAELLLPLAKSPRLAASPRLLWSPLFRTAPVGGPPDQPDYLNAVVL
ncbi:MAG: 2-amino-4-hydroxy-6-hydroxymethyldihydropteridine diphosphokinase, partial [Cyanobacteriota bacterium]|nr:2-amino-4-hydroxy-6-hydroxymethyldihydropteridine diphosphokinase [Cyanobacteriota bacterium]